MISILSPLCEFASCVFFWYTTLVFPYLIWAVVLSNDRFHRVWSLALSLLSCLTWLLFNLSFSASSYPLAVVTLGVLVSLVFGICIILSPAQLLLSHTETIGGRKTALKIFNPEQDVDYSVDIVAVHGLASNPETTWIPRDILLSNDITADSYHPMWLRDFLSAEGLNARIMAFNHNTSWKAYALGKSLYDHGNDLLEALRTARQNEARHRPIIFIGHSFGGLIIKQALVNAGAESDEDFCLSIRQKASGFIFLGTPHKGARIALGGQIQSLLGFWSGSSTSLLEVTKPESAINQDLHQHFMKYLGPRIKNTVCVFEAVRQTIWGMPIIYVVDKKSAIIDGSNNIGFETEHRNMQRFSDREDKDYQNIVTWIRIWVKEADKHHIAKALEKTREQQECLKSLYFQDMDQREYLVARAATDTCTWLLNHEKYTTWLPQHHALLWIVGKPGAGKSTLLRHAFHESSRSNDVVASFFFFGRGSDLQKSSCGLLRSLLHQLLMEFPEMLSDLTSIYVKKCETKRKPDSDCEWYETELREFLEKWILSASRNRPIRIYVDALDEAGDDIAEELIKYFKKLTDRLSPARPDFKICFSCRHYPVLAPKNALQICVENENHGDIAAYVQQSLEDHFPGDDKTELETKIIERSSWAFQWVVLIIRIVIKSGKDGDTVKRIGKKIEEIPGELGELYKLELSKIKDHKKALQLMQWICFAKRPLSLEELRCAMVVDVTNDYTSLKQCQSSMDFLTTDEMMKTQVNSLSGGLAETVEYKNQQTVRFIHQSVNDYLMERGLQNLDTSFFQDVNHYLSQSKLPNLDGSLSDDVVGLAHFRISRSCVKYMTLEGVLDRVPGFRCRKPANEYAEERKGHFPPYLRYANQWGPHAAIVEKQRIPQDDLLLLFGYPSRNATKACTESKYPVSYPNQRKFFGSISQFDLFSVAEAMIGSSKSFDLNSKIRWGETALSVAVRYRSEKIVQLLIKQDNIDINSKDILGRTPLSYAAENGQTAMVELLIERGDIEVNLKDNWGRTPLSYAAENGQTAMVELLIERGDIEVNLKDNWGRTPLSCAVENEYIAVVELLIKRCDIDINSKDTWGRTPLSCAAGNEHTAVVELLIKRRDIDINSNDIKGERRYH